jgi:hypothetical protein
MLKPPVLVGAVKATLAVLYVSAVAVPIVGAPGTLVLLLPYPLDIAIAPEATPKSVLTFVQFKPICAVADSPNSVSILLNDMAPEAGKVIYIFLMLL